MGVARTMHVLLGPKITPGALGRRYPVTMVITGIVAVMGIVTQHHTQAQMTPLMTRWGMTWPDLENYRLWTMPVSTVMQSDPGFPWIILFFVFSSLFALETAAGSLAALVTFTASDWISSPLTTLTLRFLASLRVHEAEGLLTVGSTGSSAAFHGAFAAAAMLLPRKWSPWVVALMVCVVFFQFMFERLDNSIAHALATVIGAALAHFVWRPRLERAQQTKLPIAIRSGSASLLG